MYNLKAVVKETGLKPDTLRAWERRYGLPDPHRTPSGHRLYSGHDIETLKWLINRQTEGMSISRAVALWRGLAEAGNDPLLVNNRPQKTQKSSSISAEAAESEPIWSPQSPDADVNVINQLRQRWVSACLAFDEHQSEQVLEQAFSLFSTETVCLNILQYGLAEIGMAWLQGNVTPQQEHFASSLAMRRLQALISATPPPIRPEQILVGCPPDETHTFSILFLALLLRRRGWNVIYLGANVPLENIHDTVDAMRPDLVVFGAQQLHTAATLLEATLILRNIKVPIAFGGRIFLQNEPLQNRIPGHYLGNKIDGSISAIEQILNSPKDEQLDTDHHVDYDNQNDIEIATSFQKHRSQIESDLWEKMESTHIDRDFLTEANASLARTIRAILMLQLDPAQILHIDGAWLQNSLPRRYTLSNESVALYLSTYAETIKRYMQQDAETVAQWLHQLEDAAAVSN